MINIHSLDGSRKAPYTLQRVLSSKLIRYLLLTPITVQKIDPLPATEDSSILRKDQQTINTRNGVHVQGNVCERTNNTPLHSGAEERMEALWKLFSAFLDRILFLINAVVITLVLTLIAVL